MEILSYLCPSVYYPWANQEKVGRRAQGTRTETIRSRMDTDKKKLFPPSLAVRELTPVVKPVV